MSKFRVFITDFVTGSLAPEEKVLGAIADVRALGAHDEDELLGQIDEADALLVYHTVELTGRTLERLKQCKLIVRCGVGFDNVDGAFARRRGIPLANIPDYGTEDVADSAIGMALAMARGVAAFNSMLRGGQVDWSYRLGAPLHRMRDTVLAIVGLGRIGTATALRAKALGMDVVFFDPYLRDGYDKALGLRRAETLEELLSQARILSLHCPLNDETRHLINGRTLALLPRGAYLVNTARGGVVDHSVLVEALASGRLAGAALDVLSCEPPDQDDPLLVAWRDPKHAAHHRLVLNPHAAFYTEEGFLEMRAKGAEAVKRALTGQALRNVVN